jgi:hypothetical protein
VEKRKEVDLEKSRIMDKNETMYEFIKATKPNILGSYVIDYVEQLKKENKALKKPSRADKLKKQQAKDLKISPFWLKVLFALTKEDYGDIDFEDFKKKCKKSYILHKKHWNKNSNYSEFVFKMIHNIAYFPKETKSKNK